MATTNIAALPVGSYRVEVKASGFRTQLVEGLILEVRETKVRGLQLSIGDLSQQVTVSFKSSPIDHSTISVGQVTDQKGVQEIPLNGRYFLDLGLLIPGSVTPSQSGFSTTPSRGVGALAINTLGIARKRSTT
jgi:hypothetical protein